MTAHAIDAPSEALPVPHPDDSPDDLVARAAALIPMLRAQQAEAELIGHYTDDVHAAFVEHGFARVLQPRRYGGYEFPIETFFRLVMTISQGDPGAGWCFSLGAGHALPMASFFGEQAQAEAFGPDGEFRAPHRNQGGRGRAVRVEGGFQVNATFDYCSGVPYSTHLMATTLLEEDGVNKQLVVVIPRGGYTILDDWGGGSILGMQASGSNSVTVEDVFVPDHMATFYDWPDSVGETVGSKLHDNPMYYGRLLAFYTSEIVCVAVGTARAALDEFSEIAQTKSTMTPPKVLKKFDYETQRVFGTALTMVDAAEAIVLQVGQKYMEYAYLAANGGEPFDAKKDQRLRGMLHQAGKLAGEAVEMLFLNAGSTAAKQGQRMQKYFRDISVFRGHPTALYNRAAPNHARVFWDLDGSQQVQELV